MEYFFEPLKYPPTFLAYLTFSKMNHSDTEQPVQSGQSTQSPINSKKRESNDLVSIDVIEYFQGVTVLSIVSGADFTAAVVKRLNSSTSSTQ